MDIQQKASLAATTAAASLLLLSVLLPLVSLPQTVRYRGPEVPYDDVNYTINGYYIPTVPQGAFINITLCCFQARDVFLSLFPSQSNEIAPSGPPILTMNPYTNKSTFGSVAAPASNPYGIYITAYNGTRYALTISSTWSPFYAVRVYTEWLFLVLLACVVTAYYYRQTAARRKDERRVREELAKHASGGAWTSMGPES